MKSKLTITIPTEVTLLTFYVNVYEESRSAHFETAEEANACEMMDRKGMEVFSYYWGLDGHPVYIDRVFIKQDLKTEFKDTIPADVAQGWPVDEQIAREIYESNNNE